jgi:hypothetical protein
MVRPAVSSDTLTAGTIADGHVLVCELNDERRWGLIVFIQSSNQLQAVLVPVIDEPCTTAHFIAFLRGDGESIRVRRCRFDGETWQASPNSELVTWPKAQFK